MRFFWINQSKFNKACEDGFIRADVSGTDHARRRILKVSKGDILFSFSRVGSDTYLRAILTARQNAQNINGICEIKCDYTLLDQAYDFDLIAAKLDKHLSDESLNNKYSPINKNKKRCQGYIYPLTEEAAKLLFELINFQLEFLDEENTLECTQEKHPGRREVTINRIIRDNKITRDVKRIYGGICQVCQIPLVTSNGNYSEGAHIIPLGSPYHGSDSIDNVLCLCPNHHVLFDNFSFSVATNGDLIGLKGKMKITKQHKVSSDALKWHASMYNNVLKRKS